MIAALMRLLGVNKLAAWCLVIGAGGLLLWGASALWDRWLNGVKAEAMAAQKLVDQLAFKDAQIDAEKMQAGVIADAVARGVQIGEKHAENYSRAGVATDAAAAALAGLWRAEAQAGAGRASHGQANPVSGAAHRDDASASCAAQGWIPLPLAVRIAAGADREAARGDALSGFITDQAATWPK